VEWLGDVPEHWEVVRLGRVIELTTGFPFQSAGFTQNPNDVRLLRGINITPGRIRWDNVVMWPQSQREQYRAFELKVDDVVLGMDRPIIKRGTRAATVAESDVPALLLQRVARIRSKDGLVSVFLALLLSDRSFADYLAPIFTGISVPHLSPEQIKSFRLALPTPDEQSEIVRWTEESTAQVHVHIFCAQREIELLREFRTRLIADVVTGKRDVREAAARLPQALDDEPLDEIESEPDYEAAELDLADLELEELEA
jgi:type I restriction enzyme S subunit